MKRLGLLCTFVVFAGGLAFGETTAPKRPGPCAQIVQACKTAGFIKGQKGKGLYRDCVRPIAQGQSVQGVAVDSSTVQACQQRRAERKAAKQREESPKPSESPAPR
jgi:hypothetical protein